MATFEESGMKFDLPDDRLFRIEGSQLLKNKQGISSVEFIYLQGKKLLWVEAKSSFPKAENKEDFIQNLNRFADKFVHSFEMFVSHFVGVNMLVSGETPDSLIQYDFSERLPLIFILIINCSKVNKADIPNMISVIQNSFLAKFKGQKNIWNLDVSVLDHQKAIDYGLVKELVE